jgi:hypothetical protein
MGRYLVAFVAVSFLAYQLVRNQAIERPEGVLAPDAPLQEALQDGPEWQIGNYQLRALARFELDARVLSAEHYRFDREAELSPVDLALGWGPMSANAVLATLEISQGGRFFRWSAREPMIAPAEITRHSANMHMVPADDDVRATLRSARKGNLVHLEGWLGEAKASDGWRWRSSLTRADSGAGACELVLVERIELD